MRRFRLRHQGHQPLSVWLILICGLLLFSPADATPSNQAPVWAPLTPFESKGATSELVKSYASKQSRVSAIFHNGQFNCVSSAILYIVLAR